MRRAAQERLKDLIDPDRALREAARLAYSDIGELFDDQGRLLPIKQWPDHIRAAVSSTKTRKYNADSGDGKQEDIVELKLWDKPRNLELLFKHLNLLTERIEVRVEGDLLARLAEGRKRVADGERSPKR